jgi:hypothetical protein
LIILIQKSKFCSGLTLEVLYFDRMNKAQAIQWLCDHADVDDEDSGVELSVKPAAVADTAAASAACDATMPDDV